MKRYVVLATVLMTATAGWTQEQPPAATGTPPASTAPATAATGTPGGDIASGTSAATPVPAAKGLAVRVPSGGNYTAFIQESAASLPKKIQDRGELEAPAGLERFTVYVLDGNSGYAARKSVEAKAAPAELSFSAPDFSLVQKVRIYVTGAEGKPLAQAVVTLEDSGKQTERKVIQPASQGMAEFDFIASGMAKVTVVAEESGTPTTVSRDISIDLPKGETSQTIPFELPNVKHTVEPPAGAAAPDAIQATAPAAVTDEAREGKPDDTGERRRERSAGAAIGEFIFGLIQFALLIGLLAGGVFYARKHGLTIETVLKKMGVQPDAIGADGRSVAASGAAPPPAGSTAAPVTPEPSPAADPNQCPFCGQMKDPGGNCACTVVPGAGGGIAVAASPAGSGPRLVGMAGTYMGQVFPLSDSAIIGRDAANPIPLPQDNTASRQHAQITALGGSYQIQDLGSSNGTFVNGARITNAVLNPGDEVSIGGTRFRFEI